VSFNLADMVHVIGNVENLTLSDSGQGVTASGNVLNNDIVGNHFDNTISGGAGNDTLDGAAGSDTIYGGIGNDKLTGGLGNDKFVFSAAGSGNKDVITDFSNASGNNDTVQLDHQAFTTLGAPGALNPNYFCKGTAARDGNDHIIYDSKTGNLYYDDDGAGGHSQVIFANLGNHPTTITAADFVVL
jgi:Ca2+-binding RTX toxin-like protein